MDNSQLTGQLYRWQVKANYEPFAWEGAEKRSCEPQGLYTYRDLKSHSDTHENKI